MIRLPLPVFLAVVVGLGAAPAAAQDPRPPVHPYEVHAGQRIRLWTTEEAGALTRHGAIVTGADEGGVAIVRKGRGESIAFDAMTRLEVRRGFRHLRRGAVIGLLVGAAAGFAIGESGPGRPDDWARARHIGYGAGLGLVAGTLTTGTLFPPRWYVVDLDAVRPAPPVAAGPSLGVTVSF